jgi:hypothetical protein
VISIKESGAIEAMIIYYLGLHPPMQSAHIDTFKILNLIPEHGEMYLIHLYVIKFVCDFRQVGGFLCVLCSLLDQ